MKPHFLLLLAFIVITVSCNKDDNNPPNIPNNPENKYTFGDATVAVTDVEYSFVDGDVFLFFKSDNVSNYVKITFANYAMSIPVGAFTFNSQSDNGGYIPDSNFSRGSLFDISMPLGLQAMGGSVIVSEQPGGQYRVSFLFVTDSETIKGDYTGFLHPKA